MPRLAARLVSCCAAFLCASATAAAELLAGPWVVLAPDGSFRVGCEWSGDPALAGVVEVGTRRLPCGSRPFARPGGTPTVLVDAYVPRGTPPGPFVLAMGRHRLEGVLPALPATDAPVRLMVAGGANYPAADGVATLATALGGPPDIALVGGHGVPRSIGRGGWEHRLPLLLVGGDDGLETFAPGCAAARSVGLGSLAVVVAGARDAGALATGLSPWRILVDPAASWDPGVLAPTGRAEAVAAGDVIALAIALRAPLVLACGGRAGFVSAPLAMQGGRPEVRAGGVRVIGATPAGEALAGVGPEINAACAASGLVGVEATPAALRLVLAERDAPVLPIVWRDGDAGGGWGGGDGSALWRTWLAGEADALGAIGWVLTETLAGVTPSAEERARLLAAADGDALARLAAQRILGLAAASLPDGGTDLPGWLQRDLALRGLGRGGLAPGSIAARLIATGDDPLVVHAALRCLGGRQRALILPLLVDRLRAQADGRVPLEADPLLQHRLVSAVFDATDLSPTPLRPLARALRGRLAGLALGPVDRFVARFGEFRD